MNESVESTSQFWPVVVYGAIVLSLVGAMLGISYFFGQHHKDRATGEPYAGGIVSTGSASLSLLQQQNVKRLLAYSSISHLGYILVAF